MATPLPHTGVLHGRVRRSRASSQAPPPMPLELSDAELAPAATACRAMAYQAGERAKQMQNPTTRGPIEAAAHHFARLAKKLEMARRTRL